jgi:hypothetical protein
MKRIITASLVTAAMVAACPVTSSASVAARRTPVSASIVATGTDLSGAVESRRAACKADRRVVVYRQVGTRGGGDDIRFAQDTTGRQGNLWTWSTGNTGTPGRFYAKLGATPDCRSALSDSVRVAATRGVQSN